MNIKTTFLLGLFLILNISFAGEILKENLVIGNVYYIAADSLRVRVTDDLSNDQNIAGAITRGKKVILKRIEGVNNPFIEVEINTSNTNLIKSEEYYVSYKYLTDVGPKDYNQISDGEHFIIQNLATERLRVYERRCTDENICRNHMVVEIELAIGNDSKGDGTRSVLGFMKIDKWVKFYQDNAGIYPHWFSDDLPMPPGPGESTIEWQKKKYLTKIGQKKRKRRGVRGAFGWYTAKLGPDAHYQWVHGTIGWGSDKKKYIRLTKKFWVNVAIDPRSHGCSRTDNESIAYIHHLVKAGSPVLKIYAIEKLKDESLTNYPEEEASWDYIQTKTKGLGADKNLVLENPIAAENILEEGTFKVDSIPTVIKYKKQRPYIIFRKWQRLKGKHGNIYNIKKKNMNGIFYIDEGILENYIHPQQIHKYQVIDKEKTTDSSDPVYKTIEEEVLIIGGMKKKDEAGESVPMIPEFVK